MTATASAARQRHVICMKWGTKYGPEYVNRLYAMVRRHLSGDFHFVCLTDDAAGIRSEVQCLPIPPLDLPAGIPERGWNKLATFTADLHGLRGTALFLDVDVVITGSLDDFFTQPGEFLIIHDYKRPWRITGNSSVAGISTKSASSSATSRPICRTSCTSRASCNTGRRNGAPASSTTASPPGRPTTGRRRLFPQVRGWSSFTVNAIRPMRWPGGAIGAFASSSPPPGWPSTGTNKRGECQVRPPEVSSGCAAYATG